MKFKKIQFNLKEKHLRNMTGQMKTPRVNQHYIGTTKG